MVFTDYFLWFAISLAMFLSISESLFGFTLKNVGAFKHVPLILFIPAFVLYLVSRRIQRSADLNLKGMFILLWPFLLLGLFSTLGSIYARFVLDIKETFLALGVYLLAMPMFFALGRDPSNTRRVVQPYIFVWGVSCFIAVAGAIVYFTQTAALHEIEFMVQSFFLYIYLKRKTLIGKSLGIIVILAVAVVTQKLTGYIVGAATIGYILIVAIETHATARWKAITRIAGLLLISITCMVLAIVFVYFRESLPSGNIEVRLHQYENVFADFIKSPIWGQAYTASSGEIYTEYTRRLNIPTHSDILDLLKQGGVIAFGLWLFGIITVVRNLFVAALANPNRRAYFHSMTFFTISMALCCAINPLFLKPTIALFIWGSMALALGVATGREEGQFNAI